ncbi:MAG: hypothetical protein R2824_07495 [Saprospiraceae bacterium]
MYSFISLYFKAVQGTSIISFLGLALYTFFNDAENNVASGTEGWQYSFLVFCLFFLFQAINRRFIGADHYNLHNIFAGKEYGWITRFKVILSLSAGFVTFIFIIYLLGIAPYYDTYPSILDYWKTPPPERSLFEEPFFFIILYLVLILLLSILGAGLVFAYFFYGIALSGVGLALAIHNWLNGWDFDLGAIFDVLFEISLNGFWSLIIFIITITLNVLDGKIGLGWLSGENNLR